jgi:hypothetical protein
MFKHTAGLLLVAISSGHAMATDRCSPVPPRQVEGHVVTYTRQHGLLPQMDVVGAGPVRMYTAPRKGCEFSDPEATLPAHAKAVVSADVAHDGWAYVYFPVPGDEITYAGWVDARRIAFSKDQPKPSGAAALSPTESGVPQDKTFDRSRD